MSVKPRGRSQYRLRTDGQVRGLTLVRIWGPGFGERPPCHHSACRTRSRRWTAGTRRHKHTLRGAR